MELSLVLFRSYCGILNISLPYRPPRPVMGELYFLCYYYYYYYLIELQIGFYLVAVVPLIKQCRLYNLSNSLMIIIQSYNATYSVSRTPSVGGKWYLELAALYVQQDLWYVENRIW
jgi:hypothetical protein